MSDPWPKGRSPTGRGYTQGSDSYRADDVERMCKEDAERDERKRLALERVQRALQCTCFHSSSGMDVDRCPIHGIGCA